LKPLLEHFPILLIRRIFNGDGVVTLADFAAFPLALLRYIFKARRRSGVGDILSNVIL
jgi:hypothetical protein